MISVLEAIFLGIIQGISEWLPISSSAHLALAQYFFGISADVSFDIVLHLGTLVALLLYYRNDILLLVSGILQRREKETRYVLLLLVAAVPTAVIGLFFKDFFESMFHAPSMVAIALFLTGVLLVISSRYSNNGSNGLGSKKGQVNAKSAVLIGVAQGVAVAPGISRSGATISTAILLGVEKEAAAKFSFLAGILPILGAVVLEGRKALDSNIELMPITVGFIVSAVVGYLSIALLLKVLKDSKLQLFGYYCIVLALLVLVSLFLSRQVG